MSHYNNYLQNNVYPPQQPHHQQYPPQPQHYQPHHHHQQQHQQHHHQPHQQQQYQQLEHDQYQFQHQQLEQQKTLAATQHHAASMYHHQQAYQQHHQHPQQQQQQNQQHHHLDEKSSDNYDDQYHQRQREIQPSHLLRPTHDTLTNPTPSTHYLPSSAKSTTLSSSSSTASSGTHTTYLLQQALTITPQEQQLRKQMKTLSIHAWYHLDTPTTRQTSFSKSKIAFPVLPNLDPQHLLQMQEQFYQSRNNILNHSTMNNTTTNSNHDTDQSMSSLTSTSFSTTTTAAAAATVAVVPPPPPSTTTTTTTTTTAITTNKFIPYFQQLPQDRQRDLLFDAVPRIISNDITHNTWSRSIQCLLSQSCDCVFAFICTLCYFHKILQVINKNRDRAMVVDGKEMVLDSPLSKNTFFIACNILSMKFNDDNYLTNKYFSKMYKMPITYLNEIEILTYRILGWNLYLPDCVVAQVGQCLAECIDQPSTSHDIASTTTPPQ